jgi:hypothetical protein
VGDRDTRPRGTGGARSRGDQKEINSGRVQSYGLSLRSHN